MRHVTWVALGVFAACTGERAPTSIGVDVRSFAQTAGVQSVGLLVVGAPLAEAAAEQERVETATDAVSTEAPATTGSVSIGTTTTDGTGGVRTGDALISASPTRETGEERAVNGGLIVPTTQTTGTSVGARYDYFELDLAAGQTSFSMDVPSGSHRSLFLYAFGPRSADGKAPLPTHVAAAMDVDLKAGAEQEVRFNAYAAGVLAPQVLAPSLIGLKDERGQAITALPADLSCLAVARTADPRDGFPKEMVARVRVGSITTQALSGASQPGVLVLPTGRYKLECTVNFSGKLFGFDPLRPVIATVERGKVTVATAALVKIRDLVAESTSSDPSAPPETDPTTSTPAPRTQRFAIDLFSLGQSGAARQVSETVAVSSGAPQANFNKNEGDTQVGVFALNDDGTVDTGYSGQVQLGVAPAFAGEIMPEDDEQARAPWQAFKGAAIGAPSLTTAYVVNGAVLLPNLLRTSKIGFRGTPTPTQHFLISVRPIDAAGKAARISGASYFSVRDDSACRGEGFDRISAWVLSDDGTLTLKQSVARPEGSSEHLLVAPITRGSATGASKCAFVVTDGVRRRIAFASLNAESFGKFVLALPTTNVSVAEWQLQESAYYFDTDANAPGQRVLFDVIKPASPLRDPGLGPLPGTLGLRVFELSAPVLTASPVRLDIVVR